MANGIASSIPDKIGNLRNLVNKEGYYHCVLNGVHITLIASRSLIHERAILKADIQAYASAGGSNKHLASKPHAFLSRLEKLSPTLSSCEYISLKNEGDDVVVIRTQDCSLISDIFGDVAEDVNDIYALEDSISVATFAHNFDVVIDSITGQFEGGIKELALKDGRKFSIQSYSSMYVDEGCSVFKRNLLFGSAQSAIAELDFRKFLDGIDLNTPCVITIEGKGEFLITLNEQQSTPTLDQVVDVSGTPENDVGAARTVKRLRFITSQDFLSDLEKHFKAVNKNNVPVAVRDEHGVALAIIMPVSQLEELRENMPFRRTFLENMVKNGEEHLLGMKDVYGGVEVANRKHGAMAIMLRGDTEQVIVHNLSDEGVISEEMAENVQNESVPDNDQEDLQVTEDISEASAYTYDIVTISWVKNQASEFRAALNNGQISVFCSDKKGIGMCVPKSLLDHVAEVEIKEFVSGKFFQVVNKGTYCDTEQTFCARVFYGLNRFDREDNVPKEPWGCISWDIALELEKSGIIPEIPADIKAQVVKTTEQIKQRTAKNVMQPQQKETPMPDTATPVAVQTPTVSGFQVGSMQSVDVSITGRLAVIKAQRAALQAISDMQESLKTQNGFMPVQVDGKTLYVTAKPEFVENIKEISEIFGIACSHAVVSNVPNQKKSWSDTFNQCVAEENNGFTIVRDAEIGRDVVIFPDSEDIHSRVLAELGIRLG